MTAPDADRVDAIGTAIDRHAERGVIEAGRRLLLLAGGVTTRGDEALAKAFFPAALGRGADAAALTEVVLQTHLFSGYPRTINALFALREAGAPPPSIVESEPQPLPAGNPFRARGEALCRRIYGENYERLRHNIKELHPDLDVWMVDEGYGRVLGRAGVDPATRELAALSSLVALDVPRQLKAHLRGAQNVGATRAEIEETLAQCEIAAEPGALERAKVVWDTLIRSAR